MADLHLMLTVCLDLAREHFFTNERGRIDIGSLIRGHNKFDELTARLQEMEIKAGREKFTRRDQQDFAEDDVSIMKAPKFKNGRGKRKARFHRRYMEWEKETWPESTNNKPLVQFSTLPAELRLMIWEATIPHSRVIKFVPKTTFDENLQAVTRWERRRPPPAILCVCYESRQVALKVYSLAFENSSYQPTWMNFSRDVLELPSDTYTARMHPFPRKDAKKIRQVNVHCGTYNFMNDLGLHNMGDVTVANATAILWNYLDTARLTNVRNLTLVVPGNAAKDVPWVDLELLGSIERNIQGRSTLENWGRPPLRIPEITEMYDPMVTNIPSTWAGHYLWTRAEMRNGLRLLKDFKALLRYRTWDATNVLRRTYGMEEIPETNRYLHREPFQLNRN